MKKTHSDSRIEIWQDTYINNIPPYQRGKNDAVNKVDIIQIEHGYKDSYIVEVVDKDKLKKSKNEDYLEGQDDHFL